MRVIDRPELRALSPIGECERLEKENAKLRDALRLCPFCGANKGLAIVRRKDANHEDCTYSMVACPMCCCEGPLGLNDDEAVKMWNRGVRDDEMKE